MNHGPHPIRVWPLLMGLLAVASSLLSRLLSLRFRAGRFGFRLFLRDILLGLGLVLLRLALRLEAVAVQHDSENLLDDAHRTVDEAVHRGERTAVAVGHVV